jgi:DNA replicative helicase MCM subunit Mcm2 (Cdc46/Mcm family)
MDVTSESHEYVCGCSHACFKCDNCQHEELVQNILGHIEEPKICPSCAKKWMMKMVHNRSIYLNKQIVKMQVHACRTQASSTSPKDALQLQGSEIS